MMDLSGYVLEPLWEGGSFVLYRGRSTDGSATILARAPASATLTPATLGRLDHEFALAGELDPAWAARPLALVTHDGRKTLVLEDLGGDPAVGTLGQPLGLQRFLKVAIALAAALRQVHRRGLIHKDIKPAHVLIDASGGVRLTGFGIASRLQRERQEPSSPEVIAGTLPYMAPEQTGRMNRSIDARSDLYSMGVTFYELLTGTLPFSASDPMEWIHCHIARPPVPPSERVSGIPPPVEEIILKLLAKTAEDRYQTSAGVEADLRQCLEAWTKQGRINAFRLGAGDASDRLLIPEKLYGREAEVQALTAAFSEVRSQGTSLLVLVSGYAGIGKSSVVNELHKILAPPRGLFSSGKFDQHKRDVPYATLAQSFQSLVRWLLGRDDAELREWRQELLEALGPNGQLMVNLIPELALVIGDQPAVSDLPPQDAQNRFQAVFRRFLGVFARPDHPLTLFLDDLQWLDAATLTLIEHLLTHSDVRYLLLVGAYRDNEVSAAHPLMQALAAIRREGGKVQEIPLAPLSSEDVGALVADALCSERERGRPLAELVFEKTAGNPFFTIQFMAELAEERLLAFDADTGAWGWDLPRIRAKGFTDNVADLMAGKLSRLPRATRKALGQLACLGNVAEISHLALVQGGAEAAVHTGLWQAVEAGLVHRRDSTYTFAHDRIQEAAYALVPAAERAGEHLRIGRLLASRTAPEKLDDKIFDIVNQFDRGASLLAGAEERRQVAALNLIAGKRAKGATAYLSALQYFRAGRALIDNGGWDQCFRLTFDLELNWAECECLTGELTAAETRLAALAGRAREAVDLAAVTYVRVSLFTILDRSDDAVAVGLEYLRRYDPQWARRSTSTEIREEHERLSQRLDAAPIEALLDLTPMTDPALRATMNVLSALLSPAQFTDLDLFRLIIVRMAALSVEHGNTDDSPLAYALLGSTFTIYLGHPQIGMRLGRLALDIVEKRGFNRLSGRVYSVFALHVAHWTQHLAACRIYLRRSFEAARDSGDVTFAAFARVDLVTNMLAAGEPLGEVEQEAESALEFVRGARFGLISDVVTSQLRLIRMLRGLTPDLHSFNDAEFSEREFERHLESNPRLAIAKSRYWIRKLQARVYAADYAAAAAAESEAASLLWTLPTQVELPEYRLYAALAMAGHCDSVGPLERSRCLEALRDHHRHLAMWAESGPENFAHSAALTGAELARLEGRHLDAENLYETAIRSARHHGFVQHEALSNELGARFHSGRGLRTIADAYLRNARDCYLRWGADGKVRQLEEAHPHLRRGGELLPARGTFGTPVEHLDLAAVVKLSQAISEEIDLGSLIDRLMVIALEHAGADRGLLILPEHDELLIEAEARTVRDKVAVEQRRSRTSAEELPESVLRFVARTRDSVLLNDGAQESPFSEDSYLRMRRSRSILCLPLTKQAKLVGILYLENTRNSHVFTPERTTVLKLVASQASISLENARLYAGLRQTEAYLEEAQRLSHTGHFILNVSRGKLTWSDELYRIYEFERSVDLTVAMARSRSHPDEAFNVTEKITEGTSLGGEVSYFEHRLMMPDGRVKHLAWAVHAETNVAGELRYVGTAMDVTESKRAQERLQASLNETRRAQAYLEEAQRLSHMGNWVWDVSTNRMLLSDEHRRILGIVADELDTTYEFALSALHPDDRERVGNIVEAAIRERASFDCEFRIVLPDGSIKILQSRGGPALDELAGPNEYVGTTMDITERRQNEEQMRKLVSLIENSTECIGYARSMTQIDYINAAWRRLVGLEPNEDLSKYQMGDFLPPEAYKSFVEQVLPVLARDGQWEGEQSLKNIKTNAIVPVQQTIFFITEPGSDRRIAMAAICRDITEQRRADKDLRDSLAEKEALLKEVHHRVKNNLQLISSLLNLQAGGIADTSAAEGFQESRNRVRSMALVHENLYRAGNFARIPMGTHIPNLCAHLIRAYGQQSRHVELVTDVDDIEFDLDSATSVGLIVNELVSNAFKHAFPDGRLGSVRVEMKRLSGRNCRLAVIDNGVGLPAEAENGDSLGLQLVGDLTRQLHGSLLVERDEATSFAVTFAVDY